MLGKTSMAKGIGRTQRDQNHQQKRKPEYPALVVIGDASMPITPLIFPVINTNTTLITNVAAKKHLNLRRDPALVRAERYTISVGNDGAPVTTRMQPLARRSPTKQRQLRSLTPADNVSSRSPSFENGVENPNPAFYRRNGNGNGTSSSANMNTAANPLGVSIKDKEVSRSRCKGNRIISPTSGSSIGNNNDNNYSDGSPNKTSITVMRNKELEVKSSSSPTLSLETGAFSDHKTSPAQGAGAALGKALGLSFEPKNVIKVLKDVQQEVNKEIKLTKRVIPPQLVSKSIDQSSLRLSNVQEQDVDSKIKRTAPPVVSAASSMTVYRYKHVAGNNGRVILSNFRKRPWWHSGNDKKKMRGLPIEGDISKVTRDIDDNNKKKVALTFDFVWEMCR